ncbi:P-loop containing nucleoside triphosphate hydrolase protein [Pholiota molesta]|nr:P-loop containing nucleoside triphosphate hydrolase protein [Pholiota molesta]
MKEFPNSRVVITQDDDWCSIISKDDNIMSSPSEIAEHVLAAHIIVEKDGVTFLKSKDSHSSLRHSRISSRHSVIGPLDSQNHIAGSSLISLRSTSLATSLMLATPAPSTLGKKGKKVLKRMKKAEDDVFDGYPSDIIIPVMGPTGVGKSTFINTLLNSTQAKAKVGDSLKSCTTQPLPIVIHLGPGRKSSFQNPYGDKNAARLILVDTPGFDHTDIDDMEILRRISVWLGNSYEKGMKLGGVIYLHDITQSRMLGTTRRNLDMFQKLVGKDSLKCVVLATTKWSLVDARIGNERQKQLKEQFWKHMVDAGSQIVRIGQDTASREVVNGILGRIDVTKSDINESLAIQEEIVNMGKFIPETEAGQTLQYTIKQLIEAQKRKDDEKARELLERLQKIGKELKIPFTDRIMRFLA